jgi:hypothetical protein
MSDENRLFDPADYGVTYRERKARPKRLAIAGYPNDEWRLLSHRKGSPQVHLIDGRPYYGSITCRARCGRLGIEIDDYLGPALLCPECVVKSRGFLPPLHEKGGDTDD